MGRQLSELVGQFYRLQSYFQFAQKRFERSALENEYQLTGFLDCELSGENVIYPAPLGIQSE